MSHQKTSRDHLDPGRINTVDPVEFERWCREFGCSAELLRQVIDEAGDHVTAVRAALERRQGPAD